MASRHGRNVDQGPMGQLKPYLLPGAVGFVLLLALRSVAFGPAVAQADQQKFAVMIDAGSTGSRVHAYRFRLGASANDLVLENELFKQLKPGLSSYKSDSAGAAQSLVPLLEAALEVVPRAEQALSPVQVKATAGLRLLGEPDSGNILEAVRSLLSKSPFKYNGAGSVEIMGGLSEAFFAWVTINYLTRKLDNAPEATAIMLDLGGGSTQIAMAIPRGKGNVAAAGVETRSILGKDHHMYLHSYLGYGLMAARDGVFGMHSSRTESPCFGAGTSVKFSYGDNSWSMTGVAPSFAGCYALSKAYLFREGSGFAPSAADSAAPTPVPGQPVFAMSYYVDLAKDTGLIGKDADEAVIKPGDYTAKAESICALSSSELVQMHPDVEPDRQPFLCMDLCYISAILVEGFKIEPSANVNLAKQIEFNGEPVETQWTLGAAIEDISRA